MADKSRFEQWQNKIKGLLKERSRSEIDVLAALFDFKNDERAWRKDNGFGWITFSEMLKRENFGVTDRQFEQFEECVHRLFGDVERIRNVGLKQAITIMSIPIDAESTETPSVPAYLAAYEQAESYVEMNGEQPPVAVVRSMIRHHYSPTEPPKRKKNKFDDLKAEIVELKKQHNKERKYLQEQIRLRDVENKKLRLANRVLRKRLAKYEDITT